jgi:hypothetical protein
MPFHVRYVLRRDFPRQLNYRGAMVALEIVREGPREDNRWQLQAKKLVRPETCVITESRFGRYSFETTLFNEGFVLDDSSPAAKIMARLEREGFAVGRPERVRA